MAARFSIVGEGNLVVLPLHAQRALRRAGAGAAHPAYRVSNHAMLTIPVRRSTVVCRALRAPLPGAAFSYIFDDTRMA
jgi:hypothetical protein